ncbi:MAG TPA: lipoate protein ligase C-terminal domain-containing protein, partial [Saprospiraceae bacterium]|nr:lipoate protein ligase C-terminal domain-containing protein [Saprospiraceae bacterium]
QKLRDEKYATREWNFGKSPDYAFKKAIRTNGGLLEMNLDAKNGVIENVKIFGDFFSEKGIEDVEHVLKGVLHEENELRKVLSGIDLDNHFRNISLDEIIGSMF